MKLSPIFRLAAASDTKRLAEIEKNAFSPETYGPYVLEEQDFRELLDDDTSHIVVIENEENKNVEGYILVDNLDGGFAHIESISVDQNMRGRGLGRALLEQAEKIALNAGLDAIALEVHENNDPAVHLYQSLGYDHIKTRSAFYQDGKAALVFLKRLLNPALVQQKITRCETPIHIPLAGTEAEKIFTRQQDGISCGPACLATVAKLFKADEQNNLADGAKSYSDFRSEAKPNDDFGTAQKTMTEICNNSLPVENSGAFSYNGGVAIANIVQGEGHYVVFLCKKDDLVLYYEPYCHELVIDKLADIDWRSGFGWEDNWSINFKNIPNNSFERWIDLAVNKPAAPAPKQQNTKPKPQTPQ